MSDRTIYRGFAVLVANKRWQLGEWVEADRTESEQAALALAHELRTNDGRGKDRGHCGTCDHR